MNIIIISAFLFNLNNALIVYLKSKNNSDFAMIATSCTSQENEMLFKFARLENKMSHPGINATLYKYCASNNVWYIIVLITVKYASYEVPNFKINFGVRFIRISE